MKTDMQQRVDRASKENWAIIRSRDLNEMCNILAEVQNYFERHCPTTEEQRLMLVRIRNWKKPK